MTAASNENSISCFTRLKRSCFCSSTAKNVVQYTALGCAAVASLWIPIDPLSGAGAGASLYVLLYKGYSMAQGGGQSPPPPRSWKQIALGAAVSTGMMALAFTIHGVGVPVVAAAGLIGGLAITYADPVWQLCDILCGRCCGSYGTLPSNGNDETVGT